MSPFGLTLVSQFSNIPFRTAVNVGVPFYSFPFYSFCWPPISLVWGYNRAAEMERLRFDERRAWYGDMASAELVIRRVQAKQQS